MICISAFAILAFAICYIFATIFPVGNLSGGRPDYIVTLFASFFLLVWGITMAYRVQYPKQRTILTLMFVLCFLWVLLRFVKWLPSYIPLTKYSDYFYYLPMTLTPALFLVLCVENFIPSFKGKRILYCALALAVLFFVVMALTNDLHGLVYKNYSFGIDETTGEPSARILTYSYDVVHYIAMGFIVVCVLSALTITIVKSRWQLTFASLIPSAAVIALAAAYFTLYAIGAEFLRDTLILKDFALMSSLFLLGAIEIMLDIGLVQNNGRYVTHFSKSTLPMCIFDENGKALFASEQFSLTRYEEKPQNFHYTEEKLGNYNLVIEEDLTEILNLREKIDKDNLELQEANRLLNNMIEVSKENSSLAFRLSVMNEIEESIGKSKQELASLVKALPDEMTEENADETRKTLGKTALLLGYMKQKCMLLLGAKEQKSLTPDAFKLLLNVISHDVQSVGFDEVAALLNDCKEVSFSFALAVNELANAIANAYAFQDLDLLIITKPAENTCIVEIDGKPLDEKPLSVAGANIVTKSQDTGLRVVMEVQND
ncbi:MAG: hypothetical protein IJ226_02305 [Clostridia bacterium]|nr:hypothetical protein [Clostridia bacterium]